MSADVPASVRAAAPARRLRDACEPVAMHAVWGPVTQAAFGEHGLDFFPAYVGGRGAYLGDPSGPVVAAAFGWFEPGMVADAWETARQALSRSRIEEIRDASVTRSLRDVLGDDDPGETADLLVAATATADGVGRPLFAGLRAHGVPADPALRLWWAADLVREHRGDSHLAAVNAAGLDAVQMSILTELWNDLDLLSYTRTRGFPQERMDRAVGQLEARGWIAGDALTTAGRAAREEIEARTDAQEQSIVDDLGGRLDAVCAQLDAWGERCIDAGAFPADPRKRAAG